MLHIPYDLCYVVVTKEKPRVGIIFSGAGAKSYQSKYQALYIGSVLAQEGLCFVQYTLYF